MESFVGPLLPLFQRARAADRPLALAIVLETAGSTYRKPGALLLIDSQGDYAGLLTGGCLESDLGEHASAVIAGQPARIVEYDLRTRDDLLWGLGVGCEGAMRILLMRVSAENGWQPLEHFAAALAAHRQAVAVVIAKSSRADLQPGDVALLGEPLPPAFAPLRPELEAASEARSANWLRPPLPDAEAFVLPLALPPRLLLLGAGPDASPVVDFAARLGWKVTLVDHRPAYARPEHFPGAERVLRCDADALDSVLDLERYDAAVVMSHHLGADLSYLTRLARGTIPYVGLLGPAARRERLLGDLGESAALLRTRLRAPVGLAIGGRAPESIALAIVAEIHAFLHTGGARSS